MVEVGLGGLFYLKGNIVEFHTVQRSIRQNVSTIMGFLYFALLILWQSDFGFRCWKKNLPENCRNRKFSLKWLENLNALILQHKAGFPNSTQSPAFTPLGHNSGNFCRFFGVWNSPSLQPNLTYPRRMNIGDLACLVFSGDNQCQERFLHSPEQKKQTKCWCTVVLLRPSDVSRLSGLFIPVSKSMLPTVLTLSLKY